MSVIPEPIERSTIRTVGFWNSFNITWEPCHKVNFGTVFYEIKVDSLLKNGSSVSDDYFMIFNIFTY